MLRPLLTAHRRRGFGRARGAQAKGKPFDRLRVSGQARTRRGFGRARGSAPTGDGPGRGEFVWQKWGSEGTARGRW